MNVSTSKLQAAFANLLTLMAKSEKTTVVTDSLLKLAQQADREKLLACIDDVIINNADEFVNYLIWCLSKIELDRKHASTVVSPCSRCQLTDTALTITPLSDEVSDARPIELTVPTLINAVSGHNGAANDHISNTVNMLSREELRDAYNAKFSVPLSQLRSGLTEADFANGNTLADTAQPDDQLLFVLYKLLVSMVMYAGFMRVFQDYTKWVLHSAQRASEEYVGLWNEDTIRALRSKINESLVSLTPVEQALLHFLAHIYAPCPNMVQKICTRVSAKMAGTNIRRPDGINVEQLAQDVLKAKNLEQLKKCLYITTRQIESLQKPADRSVDPAAFFVYTPADEPVGAVPMAADAGGKSAEAQTDSLSQALVRTLIWVCNYFLITQINRHIKASHDRHQLEYLLLVLGVLTFASSAIETLNGRFMLLAFLVAVNLAVYLSTKQAFGPDA